MPQRHLAAVPALRDAALLALPRHRFARLSRDPSARFSPSSESQLSTANESNGAAGGSLASAWLAKVACAASSVDPWTRELVAHIEEPARGVFLLRRMGVPFREISEEVGRSAEWVRRLNAETERRVVRAARAGARVLKAKPIDLLVAQHADCPSVPDERRASLDVAIDALEISVRASRDLDRLQVCRVGELAALPIRKAIKQLGRSTVQELVGELGKLGLRFGMNVGSWPGRHMTRTRQRRQRRGFQQRGGLVFATRTEEP